MNEWVDPRYAAVVTAMRRAQQRQREQRGAARPLRGFLIPSGK